MQVCPFDCHVYGKEDERKKCPECGEERTNKRQILLLNIRSRMRRLFANPALAKLFQYPNTRKPGDGDVWDADVMKDQSIRYLGKNVIHLGLSSDGAMYETWTKNTFTPVVCQNLNWPPGPRTCFGGLWLLAVFPPKVLYNLMCM